jgi:hypothetical protein
MTTIFMVKLSYPQAPVLIELARAIAPKNALQPLMKARRPGSVPMLTHKGDLDDAQTNEGTCRFR